MRIEEAIVKRYADLNDTDIMIWKYISTHKDVCAQISIDRLATECNVSHTTITRFVKN